MAASHARSDGGGSDCARALQVDGADTSCAALALDASASRTSLSFLDDEDDGALLADFIILPAEQDLVVDEQTADAGDAMEELLLSDLLALDVGSLDGMAAVIKSDEACKLEPATGEGDAASLSVVLDVAPEPVATLPATRTQLAPLRLRQKAEMSYLRVQVAELEAELASIKAAGAGLSSLMPAAEAAPSTDYSQSGDARAHNALVWEDIAKRQMEEKRRAEVENIKLRELLEGQLRVARSLERLLQKRSPSDTQALFSGHKRPRVTRADTSEAHYDELRTELLEHVAGVDQLMQQCGLDTVSTNLDDAQAKVDKHGHLYMESTIVKVLPFPHDRTADALWRAITVPHLQLPNGNYVAVDTSPNECKIHVDINLRLRRSQTTLHAHGLVARHEEEHRTVLVWQTLGQSDGPLLGHHSVAISGSSVIVIEPLPSSSSADAPYSVVKLCTRMWPEMATSFESHSDVVVDLIIGSFTQNSKMMFQMVENSLLQEALSPSTSES